MLEVPVLREIYISGVVITSLYIILLTFIEFRKIKYQGSIITLVTDILSPLFISLFMILFISGFSWFGLIVFIKIKEKYKCI